MAKIFVIMGKSSTGKDTIYKEIKDNGSLGLNNVIMYTTRPQRSGECDGREYYFVTADKYNELKSIGKIVESRDYNTVHGVWSYFTVDDGQIKLEENDNYIIIATLEAYEKYREYYGVENVVPIYIDVDDKTRIHRALTREDSQDNPKYVEMCRRFVADDNDFSEDKLEHAQINKRFVNDDLRQCVSDIVEYIEKVVGNVVK